jgi:hypothetical protein
MINIQSIGAAQCHCIYCTWLNIKQGWRMFAWDFRIWRFLMSLDSPARHTAAYWWDCLSANLEPIRPRGGNQ